MRTRHILLAVALLATSPLTSVIAQNTGPNTSAGDTKEADKVKEGSGKPAGDQKGAEGSKTGVSSK